MEPWSPVLGYDMYHVEKKKKKPSLFLFEKQSKKEKRKKKTNKNYFKVEAPVQTSYWWNHFNTLWEQNNRVKYNR